MRKISLIAAILLIAFAKKSAAQAPTWGWARNSNCPGTFSHAFGYGIATDTWGNVYTTGYYENPITFGAGLIPEPAFADYFLVKHNRAGGVVWNRWATGIGDAANGMGVATDISGNVLVVGTFTNSIAVFGTDTVRNDSTNGGMFLVKYDTSGHVLWARGGIGNCPGYAVTTDGAGNIYVAGGFTSSLARFGGITLYNDTTGGFYNQYLVKYSASGNIIWARSNSAGESGYYCSISADDHGHIYLSGTYRSSRFTIGGTTLINYSPTGRLEDVYLARYDTAGTLLWARSAGGNKNDEQSKVVADQYGNAYIIGSFTSDSIQFGTTTLALDTFGTPTGKLFLTKYDSLGNVTWAVSAHAYSSTAASVVLNVTGEPCIAGYFLSDQIIFGADTFFHSGNFLVQYDIYGSVGWAKVFDNTGCYIQAMACDGANHLLLTGYQHGTIILGRDTLLGSTGGVYDVFVAKLGWLAEGVALPTTTVSPIKAYPVPTNDILNISLGQGNFTALNIYDANGKKVYSKTLDSKIKSSEFQLNTAGFADGVYIIHALRNDGVNYQKVVIQH